MYKIHCLQTFWVTGHAGCVQVFHNACLLSLHKQQFLISVRCSLVTDSLLKDHGHTAALGNNLLVIKNKN